MNFEIFSKYIKKKQIAQKKNRENIVADQIRAYVICEWSHRQRIPSSRSRNRSRSGGGAGGAPIFSPSPMDPSPVSLRGGFMGLTVPSSHMNDIYEEGLLDTIEAGLGASREQTSSERTPLLGGKNSDKR